MRIEISYQLTVDELRRGLNQAFPFRRWNSQLLVLSFILDAVIAYAVNVKVLSIFALCMALFYTVRKVYITRFRFRKSVARICVPTTAVMTESLITFRTELAYSEVQWHAYREIRDMPDFIGLFRTKKAVMLIPKRAFSAQALGELNVFINYRAMLRGPIAVALPGEAVAGGTPTDNSVA